MAKKVLKKKKINIKAKTKAKKKVVKKKVIAKKKVSKPSPTKRKTMAARLSAVKQGKKKAFSKPHIVDAHIPQKKLTKKEISEMNSRDQLVKEYIPYASSIAGRVYQNLSSVVDYEEVLCMARMGLLEAAKRYDLSQNVDFKTFAYYRIKGSIYDGLRKAGWIPRALYAKIKFEEAANDYLQHMSHHADSRKESKEGKGNDDAAVAATVNSLASIYIISLDANEDMELEDQSNPDIEEVAELMQVRNHMRDAIDSLPPTEKKLIRMYYFQNRTLEEIGERLGLSKSWTSRLHARALEILLKRIKGRAHQRPEPRVVGGNY